MALAKKNDSTLHDDMPKKSVNNITNNGITKKNRNKFLITMTRPKYQNTMLFMMALFMSRETMLLSTVWGKGKLRQRSIFPYINDNMMFYHIYRPKLTFSYSSFSLKGVRFRCVSLSAFVNHRCSYERFVIGYVYYLRDRVRFQTWDSQRYNFKVYLLTNVWIHR